jgi:hypothetical protein
MTICEDTIIQAIVSFYLKFVLIKVEGLTSMRQFLLRKSAYIIPKICHYFTQAVEEAVLCTELQNPKVTLTMHVETTRLSSVRGWSAISRTCPCLSARQTFNILRHVWIRVSCGGSCICYDDIKRQSARTEDVKWGVDWRCEHLGISSCIHGNDTKTVVLQGKLNITVLRLKHRACMHFQFLDNIF